MNLISQSTEYALRAVVFLASNPERMRSAAEISQKTGVPVHYLGKVLKQLVRTGVLRARRGPGGGFCLTASPDNITVLDIVNAIDPITHVTRCPLGQGLHPAILCPLHRHLEDAILGVENAFRSATVGALAQALPPDTGCPAAVTHDA